MAGRRSQRAADRGAPADVRSVWERAYDRVTVMLLLAGGLVAFLGWLIGAGMLWAGPRWTRREKLLGTLVFPLGPGGLLLLFLLLPTSTEVCTHTVQDPRQQCTTSGWSVPSWVSTSVFTVVIVLGLAVGALLAARARRPGRADWTRRPVR